MKKNFKLKKMIGKKIKKGNSSITGLGTILTNNEMKVIMKVIKSLENGAILSKETTRKITSQEGGFFNFISSSMTAGLPLMKKALTTLAKSVLLPLGLKARMAATDAAI